MCSFTADTVQALAGYRQVEGGWWYWIHQSGATQAEICWERLPTASVLLQCLIQAETVRLCQQSFFFFFFFNFTVCSPYLRDVWLISRSLKSGMPPFCVWWCRWQMSSPIRSTARTPKYTHQWMTWTLFVTWEKKCVQDDLWEDEKLAPSCRTERE